LFRPPHLDKVSCGETGEKDIAAGRISQFLSGGAPVPRQLVELGEVIVVVGHRDRGAHLGDEGREVIIVEVAQPGELAEIARNAVFGRLRAGPFDLPVPSGMRNAPATESLSGWYADAAGEGGQLGKGVAAVGSEEVFGYAVDGWPVADLSGRGALG
jgi:hypothetical protein